MTRRDDLNWHVEDAPKEPTFERPVLPKSRTELQMIRTKLRGVLDLTGMYIDDFGVLRQAKKKGEKDADL